MPEISVQLYSLREQLAENYEKTIRALFEIGFANVEPAGYPGSTPEAAAKLFAELGIKAPSAHCALPIGDDRNKIIEQAQMMGHKYLITGCPDGFGENYKSADAVKLMASKYCEAAEFAAKFDIQVGYHNHDWDLVELDGARLYKVFLENTPDTVLWEADTFWIAKAGLDVAAFIEEIGVRGKCLHFKDGVISAEDKFKEAETEDGKIMVSDSIPFLPAGTGDIDLPAASEVANHAEYICVELDSYTGDMLDAVRQSYSYLKTL